MAGAGDGGALLLTFALLLSVSAAHKCGPCECSTLKPEEGDTAAGLLVNCSGVAPPLGALPHPALTQDPQIQEALRKAAFVRLVLSRCDANRLQALPTLQAPVRALDLSHNGLTALEGNALLQEHKDSLREIDMDYNSLEDLDGDALRDLKQLRVLRVEHNALQELRLEALPPGLLKLRAAGNSLTQLTAAPSSAHAMQLQDLDLFNNKLEELSEETLRALWSLLELRALRLAGNPFRSLEGNALLRLPQLRHLDVSRCGLKALGFTDTKMLSKMEVLSAGHNALSAPQAASIAKVLPTLKELHLSHNEIEDFPALAPLSLLQVLNLSENSILTLPPALPKLPSLLELDLSRNKLQTLPPGALAASSLPALRALWLDGNEALATLQLEAPSSPRLWFVSASGLTRLRALGASAFKGLRSTAPRVRSNFSAACDDAKDGSLPGLTLRLSGNEQLTDIDEHAFDGLPLCELDLSGCALTSVSEGLAPWREMRAVDLQRNPWACECALQWMVDSVVVPMYDKGNSQLLYELRCETPSELRGRRLVHFYAWPKALCSPREKLQRMLSPEARSNTLSAGRGMLIALCAVGVIFVATVVAGLTMHYQALKRRRRQNRRV